MKKLKAIMAAVTAMTLTMGAVGVTAYAEEKETFNCPVDVNEKFEGLRGDVDCDGELKVADASLIVRYIADKSTLPDKVIAAINAQGDYNGDGVISTRDASDIVKDIVKKNYKNKSDSSNKTPTDEELSVLEELMNELSELDPDTPIEEIEGIISEYVNDDPAENTEPTGIAGDVNNDGEVTVQDGALIAKYLANRKYMTQEEFDALTVQGDFNGDGQVNARDIRDITKYRVDMFKNKSSEKENDEELMKELSELDPDTPIEDIESIISEYVNDNTSEEEETVNTEPTGIIGDVNYDGVLTIRDAALIAKYMSHPEYLTDAQINAVTAQGDFNGDGRVSVRDASDIVRYIAKSAKDKENTVSTEPAEIIPGDMNGDGVVSFRDAAIIAKYLANLKKHPELEEALKKGDFNGDGITNVRDYAAILEHLVENGVFGDRYKTWKDIVWREGDANLDDVFDLTDLVLTTKYALSPASFPLENEVAFVNADMNSDDKIDSVDINIMIEKQLGK